MPSRFQQAWEAVATMNEIAQASVVYGIGVSLAFSLACGSRDDESSARQLPRIDVSSFAAPIREALETAYRRADGEPKNAGALGKYCMILQAHEQVLSAAECYKRAREVDSSSFNWPYYQSVAYHSAGDTAHATRAIEDALRIRSEYLPALLLYGQLLLESGKVDQSLRIYSEAVRTHLWDPAAQYQFGRALLATGDTTKALEAFGRACELYPSYAEAHYSVARAYEAAGNREKAAYHRRQYQSNPLGKPPVADPILEQMRALAAGAQVHIRNAAELERSGQLQQAVAANLRAVQIDPTSVQAHVNLISLYGRLSETNAAEYHYFKAIELQPPHADAYYNYGVLAFSRKDYDAAREAFKQAVRINSEHAEAHNNLGFLLASEGRSVEAVVHLKRALDIRPGHQIASYHIGRILMNQGQAKSAITYLAQAIGDTETEYTAELLHELARAHLRSGNLRTAHQYAQAAYRTAVSWRQRDIAERAQNDLRVLDGRLSR
jgi:tetratricopeptide (TPR) repeat protein